MYSTLTHTSNALILSRAGRVAGRCLLHNLAILHCISESTCRLVATFPRPTIAQDHDRFQNTSRYSGCWGPRWRAAERRDQGLPGRLAGVVRIRTWAIRTAAVCRCFGGEDAAVWMRSQSRKACLEYTTIEVNCDEEPPGVWLLK